MATSTRTKKTTAPAALTGPAGAKKSTTRAAKIKPKSRAVIRDVEAGSSVDCSFCGERVKFQAKMRNKQVICNVYVSGAWNRVEHFHADCYEPAGSPHGPAEAGTDHRRAAANAASANATPAAPAPRKAKSS